MKEYVGCRADKAVAVLDPGTRGGSLLHRLDTPMDLSALSPLQSDQGLAALQQSNLHLFLGSFRTWRLSSCSENIVGMGGTCKETWLGSLSLEYDENFVPLIEK